MEAEPRDHEELEGRQATVGRGSGSGGESDTGVGPPIIPGSLESDKGMVPGSVQPCSAACSGYLRVDHGRAGGAVQLNPAPGGKYLHFGGAVPGGQLGTNRGRDQVGGETLTQSPLRGTVGDTGRPTEKVAGRSDEDGKGRNSGRGSRRRRETTGGGAYEVYIAYGGVQLGDGGRSGPDFVQEGATCRRGHVVGVGTDPQEEKGILWQWARGGDVKGSGSNSKSLAHGLHHLPRLPPQILGGSWHRYRHPRGQATLAASTLERGGPVHDLTGPEQSVWRLG